MELPITKDLLKSFNSDIEKLNTKGDLFLARINYIVEKITEATGFNVDDWNFSDQGYSDYLEPSLNVLFDTLENKHIELYIGDWVDPNTCPLTLTDEQKKYITNHLKKNDSELTPDDIECDMDEIESSISDEMTGITEDNFHIDELTIKFPTSWLFESFETKLQDIVNDKVMTIINSYLGIKPKKVKKAFKDKKTLTKKLCRKTDR